MSAVVTLEDQNRNLRQLWRSTVQDGDWPVALPLLWPLQYPPAEAGGVVFTGLNPSVARTASPETVITDVTDLASTEVSKRLAAQMAADLGRVDPGHMYPYFKPFRELTPAGYHWEHVDLFAVRHRDQGMVQKALSLDGEWSAFAERQFSVACDLLERLEPSCVVVVNALASTIVRRRFGVGSLDENAGCHWLTFAGRRVPLFLSGMLSGQRALDIHSRQRLAWHIRRVLASLVRA